VSLDRVTPPPNDGFASRILLEGSQARYSGHNRGAIYGTWWTWTAPVDGVLELALTGELQSNGHLRVFRGETEETLQVVGSTGFIWPATQRFPVVAGTSYQIALGTIGGVSGQFTLELRFVP